MSEPRPDTAGSDPRRLPEIDLLRAVALLAVVFIHAASWMTGADATPDQGPVAAAIGIARFCVPALIFSSGLVLYRARARRAHHFLRRRWRRLLVPWLVWVPVYGVLDVMTGQLPPDPHDVAVWLAYGPGHLYFLVLIAQLSLLVPLVPRRRRTLVLLAVGAFALQLAAGLAHTYAPAAPGAWAWPLTYLPNMEAPFWVGWFLLGCLAGSAYERIAALRRLWPLALALLCAGGAAVVAEAGTVPADWFRQGTAAFLWPSLVPTTLGATALLLWGGRLLGRLRRLTAVVTELSRHSLGLYLGHVMVLDLMALAVGAWPGAVRVGVLLVGSLAITYLGVRCLVWTSAGAVAVGEGREPVPVHLPGGLLLPQPRR